MYQLDQHKSIVVTSSDILDSDVKLALVHRLFAYQYVEYWFDIV